MSEFEKYLKENKQRFDLQDLDPQIWENIEAGVKPKTAGINSMQKYIIVVLAAILLSFCCYKWLENTKKRNLTSKMLAEYGFEDADLTDRLDSKINTIQNASFPVSFKSDLQRLVDQVKYIDQYYLQKIGNSHLKQNEKELTEEVLLYYKAKSEILDKVLHEIDKINSNEKTYRIDSEKTSIHL